MGSFLLSLLSLPIYLGLLWVVAVAARRVLGFRVGVVRGLVGAFVGWSTAAGLASALPRDGWERPVVAVGLLIPVAGCAFLATLVFLFVAEMAVPSGGPGLVGRVRQVWGRLGRARRYSQISRRAVRYGLGSYLSGRRSEEGVHRYAALARSLRRFLEDSGVTFVKLGQVLSTRSDLLPPVFVAELSLLQSQVAPAPAEEMAAVLRAELGADPEDVFAEFDWEPLAAASIAQVYRARTTGGVAVVVKVQRPRIRELVERDLDIVRRIADALERRAGWARAMGLRELAEGFAEALVEELDFRVEARNLAAVRSATPDGPVRLPEVVDDLSTDRVLVMSRLDGTPIGDADLPADERTRLARSLLDCVLRQITVHGVFHADPHPGNVLVLAGGGIGLLDFGSVGRLDAGLRAGLRSLLLAVDRGDPAGMRDGLLEIVERPDEIDEQRLERALGTMAVKHLSHDQAPDMRMFTELFRLIADFRLAVPPAVAAVFRALATLEGTLTGLAPGFNLVAEAKAFASTQIGERLAPESLRQTATDELLSLLPVLRRLPRRLDRIGGALEEGRVSVNVRPFADERDRAWIRGLLHEFLLAMAGLGAGLIAALLLASDSGPELVARITVNHLIGYNLLVVSALIGLRLLYVVFRDQSARDRRLS